MIAVIQRHIGKVPGAKCEKEGGLLINKDYDELTSPASVNTIKGGGNSKKGLNKETRRMIDSRMNSRNELA